MNVQLTVFEDTLRCGLLDSRQRFGETFYLHLRSVGFNQRVFPNCGKRLSVSLRHVRRQYLEVRGSIAKCWVVYVWIVCAVRARVFGIITVIKLISNNERNSEPWWLSRYSDSLRAGRSGDRIPVGAIFSAPVQTGSEAHPASCTMGTGFFSWGKGGRGVVLTAHPHLVCRGSRKRVELCFCSP